MNGTELALVIAAVCTGAATLLTSIGGFIVLLRKVSAVHELTNSLADSDEPLVNINYNRYRVDMLKLGVNLYEVSTEQLKRNRQLRTLLKKARGRLHAKLALVDREWVLLGSMNLDPRSARLNTELGVIIDSPEMARQLLSFADAGSSYRLRLDATGRNVEWVEEDEDGKETAYDVPPETSAWQRFKLRLIAPFIPQSQL